MLDLLKTLSLVQDFCEKNRNILIAYLFGSYADGTAHQRSDLDLAFLFNEPVDLRTEIALQVKLSEVTGIEAIDLLNLNKAPLYLQFKVITTGRLIYEVDPDQTSDFLENLFNRYHDREFRYKMFFKEWDEGLKEDYSDGQSR